MEYATTGNAEDLQRFIKHDQLIQQGLCPNGHGLMQTIDDYNQECLTCHFGYFSASPIKKGKAS